MSHAGQGPPPRGRCSIVNSHGDQVHVNESFIVWFNTITLKQFIAPFCFLSCSRRFFHSFLLRAMLDQCTPAFCLKKSAHRLRGLPLLRSPM